MQEFDIPLLMHFEHGSKESQRFLETLHCKHAWDALSRFSGLTLRLPIVSRQDINRGTCCWERRQCSSLHERLASGTPSSPS